MIKPNYEFFKYYLNTYHKIKIDRMTRQNRNNKVGKKDVLNQNEDERKPATAPTVNQEKRVDTTVPTLDDTRNNDRSNTDASLEMEHR